MLEESGRVIEDLERKVDVKMKEKGEMEKEKNGLEMEVEIWEVREGSCSIKTEYILFQTGKGREREENFWASNENWISCGERKWVADGVWCSCQRVTEEGESNADVNWTIEILTRDKAEMEEVKTEALAL